MEIDDLIMVHHSSRRCKIVILNPLCLPEQKLYIVNYGYLNKQGFLLFIYLHETEVFRIICHNTIVVLLLRISINCLIDVIHLYVLPLRKYLEFEKN